MSTQYKTILLALFSLCFSQNTENSEQIIKDFIPAGRIEALIDLDSEHQYILVQLDLKNDSLFNLIEEVLPDMELFSGPASYHRVMTENHLNQIKGVLTEEYYLILKTNYLLPNISREYWVEIKQGSETQGTWSEDDAIEYTCACLDGANDCVKLGWDESWWNPLDYWGEAWYGFQPPYFQNVSEIRVTVRGAQCDDLPLWSETYMGMMDSSGNWSQNYELSINYTDNEFIVDNTWSNSMLVPRIGSEDNYCIDHVKLEFYFSCEGPENHPAFFASDEENCQIINLDWELPNSTITHQIVYRDEVSIAQLDPSVNTYEDWGAQINIEHNYCIEAYNDCGQSILRCDRGSLKPLPPSVSNVEASDGSFTNEVSISWQGVENIINYKIYRDNTWMGIISGSQSEYTDIIPSPDTVHNYCIESINECGESDWSCDTGFIGSTLGDINQDNNIDILDVVIIANIVLGNEILSDEEWYIADLNYDNDIDVLDIIVLINLILYQ